MNKMKKVLLGTALSGVLIAGAGAGTFSWFNASYDASGTITNHTLEINGSVEATETLDFGNKMLAPSRTVSDSISIKNTGSLDQIVRLNADFALYDGTTNVGTPDKSGYEMTATVFYNGARVASATGNVEEIDEFLELKEWWPSTGGIGNFVPGAEVKVDLNVKLLESAGNEYQGKTLRGELKVEARQTDANSQF